MSSVVRVFRRCFHSDKNIRPKGTAAGEPAQPQRPPGQPGQPDGCDSPPPTQMQPLPADRQFATASTYAAVPLGPPGPIQMPMQPMPMPMPMLPPQPLGPTGPPVANVNAESLATNPIFLRALFSFDRQTTDDLSFKKGDRLFLIRHPRGDWWYAKHMETQEVGYIPSNYVVIDDGKVQSQEAWFDISRRDADRLLLYPGNPRGTYLIRPSSDPRNYALSIRDEDEARGIAVVKHYKIRTLNEARGFYISAKNPFPSFGALISYYEKTTDGLCCKLTALCQRQWKPPVKFKEFEVKREAVILGHKLGSGSFGEVWHAKLSNSVDVAVKLLKDNGSMSVEDFLKEGKTMHKLSHPKIVQLLGVCTTSMPIYIITEFMCNGSLLSYLRNERNRPQIIPTVMIDMLAQICEGMEYLEAQNYIHRDLRAANILVGENNIVKVADFGLAKFSLNEQNEVLDTNTKFPVKWTAPEALEFRRFSVKSDVWSFGVVIFEVTTYGRSPFPGLGTKDVYALVLHGGRMQRPSNEGDVFCPNAIWEQMNKCWAQKAEDRPTFQYLKEYFDNYTVNSEGNYAADQPQQLA